MILAEDQKIEIKCLEVKQPIGTYYIGVIGHEDLVKISYADIRRLEVGDEKREVEIYSGIQRELSKNRVKEISKYVNLIDATFPSSVILHINEKDVEYNNETKIMYLPFRDNVAKVLDGQHRIAGLENYEGTKDGFDVNVTIFIEMELEDQAIVFATINKTQTKVNKSLVADLFAFAKFRSPQKTCHNIVRALNQKEGSPFKDKIKILGTADDKEKETITQATFSEKLMQFLSKDPMDDRNTYKKGKIPEKYTGIELERRPLRNLFIEENDADIAKIIWEYFDAVQEKWPNAWWEVKREMILNKSTGFLAFMRFFKDAYVKKGEIGSIVSKDYYKSLFDKTTLKEKDFNRDNFLPGSGGQSKLYNQLVEETEI
ncbi:DGQHR domain-containing protein [Sinomicrobium oceani]|uniref:DGQHR domain-containing protein n=1 Tax=Sinomicrobium oceani TaxID=1150368 RepID=A0A1K1RVL5_9FLAO|nr:DGQHR domain-containing protein [Sinomicrobium oceani]SFW76118.1 DGQHR domain-containing protein [Sinomicrobium oceani]